ncbi:hypothetical protein IKD56_04000 [bacterium]|nr:hypothetical protein [bacterium]
MINILPQTEVRLLKTPLEKEGNHTMTFSNINSQTAYFLSKTIKSYSEFTYQRESASLVVGDPYDTINTCNYLMYRNNGFSNKYFYAYITKMEYISENSTRIYFEIDSLQTWYFNINYKECFVEREHVNDDTIGLHTVPEDVELGDYIDQSVTTEEQESFSGHLLNNSRPLVVVSVTQTGISAIDTGTGREYNGIYSGLINICFPNPSQAEIFILYLDSKFSETPVVSVFLAPWKLCTDNLMSWDSYTDSQHPEFSFSYKEVPYRTELTSLTTATLSKTNYLDNNYVPNNNKLLTYPYKYFLVDNNVGGCFDYKYEYFSDANCTFNISGALSVGCSIKARPINYNKKSGANNLFAIDESKLPTCAYINDSYTNYLTANAVNLGLSIGTDIIKLGASTVTENPVGMAGSALSIANTVGQVYERSKRPLQAHGGVNQGDFNYSNRVAFNVYRKSIKAEFATIIDDYFSMYGYKVNNVKIPNITGRANWNYVKTIGCNFTGDIPQEDIEKIRNLFNNGITFWHNEENFLNYSASNGII